MVNERITFGKAIASSFLSEKGFNIPNERPPRIKSTTKPMKDIRHNWKKALTDAKLEYFWLYNLRHSYASRLSAAGVSDLFVAQMIGHSSPSILQRYSKAIDE